MPLDSSESVSYTHLDVYKRQYMYRANNPKDEATAKQYASEDLFDADYGIAPVYNTVSYTHLSQPSAPSTMTYGSR